MNHKTTTYFKTGRLVKLRDMVPGDLAVLDLHPEVIFIGGGLGVFNPTWGSYTPYASLTDNSTVRLLDPGESFTLTVE